MYNDRVLLITGGTGSFGNAVLQHFINSDIREIRVFSRDEKKQDDMRKRYKSPRLKFYIGDVRDYHSVASVMKGVDYVFQAAALKQVPSCEFHPLEAIKTNVLGTENVLRAAVSERVKRVVCLSTDKAVYPINSMGMSKALMEKVMVATSRTLTGTETVICGTRYGNVMASRGSVIPLFIRQIQSGIPLTLTDPSMTRFMMSLDDAVRLVLFAFEHGRNGDIFVQKAPAATIQTLVTAILELMGKADHPVKHIGRRHGEKIYETLLGVEEMAYAQDLGRYYRITPDGRDLNYERFVEGEFIEISPSAQDDYTSHNTLRLDVDAMKRLLLELDYVRRALRGETVEEGF